MGCPVYKKKLKLGILNRNCILEICAYLKRDKKLRSLETGVS
jgi:hypothetical protein